LSGHLSRHTSLQLCAVNMGVRCRSTRGGEIPLFIRTIISVLRTVKCDPAYILSCDVTALVTTADSCDANLNQFLCIDHRSTREVRQHCTVSNKAALLPIVFLKTTSRFFDDRWRCAQLTRNAAAGSHARHARILQRRMRRPTASEGAPG